MCAASLLIGGLIMKIMIVRHGDPNYEIDGLTPKGAREAELLSNRLVREQDATFYCSVLGRARLTLAPTLDRLGARAEYLDWLRELSYERIVAPNGETEHLAWDLMPEWMEEYPSLYLPDRWTEVPFIRDSGIPAAYETITRELDRLLARHGYERENNVYRVTRSNHDTLVLVCHFGLGAVLLSHLMNCSPYSIWQNAVMLPTSVTTLYTEEREAGLAAFRCVGMGDISHLFAGGEEPSFSGRFCECFEDETRH